MKRRKMTNRLIAGALLFILLFTECGAGFVHAAEISADKTQTEQTQEETETSEEAEETNAENVGTVSGAVPIVKEEEEFAKEELQNKEGMVYVLGRPMTESEEEEQMRLTEEYVSKLVPLEPDKAVKSILDDSEDMAMATNLPTAYDSRTKGYITPIRNQNPYGTCWAFASINMAESSLIKKGLMSQSSADLSELHLAFYTFRFVEDPLGGTVGDSNYRGNMTGSGSILEGGGNYSRSTFTLSSWMGAVSESDVPYSTAPSPLPETVDAAYGRNVAKLKNSIEINTSDRSLIKQAIMDHGSVGIMYYATSSSNYFNPSTAAQYCNNGSLGVNHGVSVVGWDDNYSVNNFSTKPSANGAWLVKNSWGTWWGNNGYFWLSYEDATINETVFAFDMMAADTYDNNYQYDGAGGDWMTGGSERMDIANVFTAHARQGKKEILKAVSFAINSVNVDYSIQIYKNPTDALNPASGTAMFATPQTGKTTNEGYYTVDLRQPVELEYGDVFSVVISFTKPGDKVYVAFEGDGGGSTSAAAAGQSFYSMGGYGWTDFGKQQNSNFRIKAFTVNTDAASETVPVKGISMLETEGTLEPGASKIIAASVVPANATNKKMSWKSSDTSVATVDGNGKVTAIKAGTAVITATTAEGGYSAQYTLEVQEKSQYTGIELWVYSTITYIGTSYQFEAVVYPTYAPDTTVTWSTSNPNVVDVDQNGVVTATGIGTATITATANGDKRIKNSADVTVPNNKRNQVRSFVNRMYTVALNRKADNAGATYWTDQLMNGQKDGATVAKGFVLSPEMEKRKLNNSQYVDMLYKTFFNRNSDAKGKAYWMNLLENGVSRAYVFRGFCHSQEFANICGDYGITRGSITLTENRDKNHNITMYVFRCYERTLGRKPDVKGLNFWTGQILTKKRDPKDVAGNFVFSTEFKNKKLSDEEYVKVLYRMFFDREYNAPGSDPNGIKFWLNELKSGRRDRYKVFMGFANSQEFKNVLKSFGL